MNDKGKLKKFTVILMIVAILISLFSLAWVIIFKDSDEYERRNREFYEQTYTTPKHTQAVNTEPDPDEMIDIEITVPVSLVLENINSDSRLTDEQSDMGFKSVAFDGEGSVTYVISKADHKKFLKNYRYEVVNRLETELKATYKYIDKIDYNDTLSQFSLKVERSSYSSAEAQAIATSISLPSMIYQLYANEDIDCTVSFADTQTSNVIDTIKP